MNNAQTHTLRTPHRDFSLTVVELPDRIDLTLTATRYGEFDDLPSLGAWLAGFVTKYEHDPRPLAMVNQPSTRSCTATATWASP